MTKKLKFLKEKNVKTQTSFEWKKYVTLGKSVDHSMTAMRQYANEKIEFGVFNLHNKIALC